MNIGAKTVTMVVNDKKTKKTKVYQRILTVGGLDSRNPVSDSIIDMMESYLYKYECDHDECVSFELPKFKKLNNGFKIYRYDSRTYSFQIIVGESLLVDVPFECEMNKGE